MEDQSALDRKHFIDVEAHNCPFCNRNHVVYGIVKDFRFNWSQEKICYGYLTECASCGNRAMHLSFEDILNRTESFSFKSSHHFPRFKPDIDIDSAIFYSQPTSFIVIDSRIRPIFRELLTAAEECLRMNYLTAASACMRKAIHELLVVEEAEGETYEERIEYLMRRYPDSDPRLFNVLSRIQGMTSDKVHEQSWDRWDSPHLRLIIETLKTILFEIHVLPQIKRERLLEIERLQESLKKDNVLPP